MREGSLEKVDAVLRNEDTVRHSRRLRRRVEERSLDIVALDESEQSGKADGDLLEGRLVVAVGEDEEHVLEEAEIVGLEEPV